MGTPASRGGYWTRLAAAAALVAMTGGLGCASRGMGLCTTERADEMGVNHARSGEDMNATGYAMLCPADRREGVQAAYRAGFERGMTPVLIGVNQRASAESRCVEAHGMEACGYDCIEAYGTVECGAAPDHNCVEAYGEIQCGKNCRERYGAIECDEVSAVTGEP